jgi:hypothetical protein
MAPAREYVLARRALLDTLEALGGQRDAVILCGAQAIYVHTGEEDLAVSPYTTDADLALRPEVLLDKPPLKEAMEAGGLRLTDQPGIWQTPEGLQVDLLVPEKLGGPGRRGARLGPSHGSKSARKVAGLEPVLIDNALMRIASLEAADSRSYVIAIAGAAALLVAKLFKIAERVEQGPGRLSNKDALDVFRILRAVPTERLAETLHRLAADPLSGQVTKTGIASLRSLFSHEEAPGIRMLLAATLGLEEEAIISASCRALADDLLRAM